jgi:hypothetical protein
MVLSGLRAFEQETIDQLVNQYSARKQAYRNELGQYAFNGSS